MAALLLLASVMVTFASREAQALPSFARQTGQPCGACHTDFPQLTPFGRRFKLGGYTFGGGSNRLPDFSNGAKASAPMVTKGEAPADSTSSGIPLPPISMMAIGSFTHTAVDNPNLPGTGPGFRTNDNVILDAFSAFYGGAISDHVGAFAQVTFNNPLWHWDNTDVRYTDTAKIGGLDILWGITAHNNPSVQDVWNTTPAWSFPFQSSSFMVDPGPNATAHPGPALTPATTIIDGHFAQQVVGMGGYAFINDTYYLEATAYKSLNATTLSALGITQGDSIDRWAPYFRIAAEPHWGRHSLEVGAFAMIADLNPQPLVFFGAAGTDHYVDVGVDSQYQYQGDDFWLTLKALYIHEDQQLTATSSPIIAGATNSSDQLNTFRAQASLAYGNDNRVVFTGGYFNTSGSTDPLLNAASAAGSPNTDGFIAEIAYIPFVTSKSPLWPWFNARIGLQYVWYDRYLGASTNYDGAGTNARDNNTLYIYAWLAW